VAFLISQAIFRPKSSTWWLGRTSLEINPLVELIDMYHAHEATERHDKIFALLGMSSDDLTVAGLSPDYDVPWAKVFMNLLLFVFGKILQIETLGDGDLAVVRAKGYIISKVTSVKRNISWSDWQEVEASFWNDATNSRDKILLAFRISANPILEDNLICVFENVSTPMIVRAFKDYFGIVKIAAIPDQADPALDLDHVTDGSPRVIRYRSASLSRVPKSDREIYIVRKRRSSIYIGTSRREVEEFFLEKNENAAASKKK